MKKNNLLRLFALTLSVLMLLSLSLSVLTSCDDGKDTDTTTETETDTNADNESATETETETETTADLTTMEPKDALTTITNKLSTTADSLSKNFEQQIKDGKFSFSMPTNVKIDVAGKVTTAVNMGGMNQTTEMGLNASVTLAEGGVAVTITIPEMMDITVICVDKTLYFTSAVTDETEKEKYTLTDEDLADLLASLNGSSDDAAENAELEQFMALLTPLKDVKPEDVFASIEAAVADGNLTVTCKGIKAEFVATLTTILGQLEQIGGEAGEAQADEDMGDMDDMGDLDDIFGEETDSLTDILEMFNAISWDDITFSVTVNAEGQILGASFAVDIDMSETIEGLGEMSMKYSISTTVTVTRGDQTVAAPADADSYKEAETGDDSILPDLSF